MTTLAKNAMRDYEVGTQNELPVIAADIIYQGAAVGDNSAGYMRPLVAGDAFRGFSVEKVDNSAGAAGAKRVKLYTKGKVVLTVVGSSAVTDVDRDVYATDDATFTLAPAAAASKIGKVVRWISGTSCVVAFDSVNHGELQVATVTLTTAEILALFTTPKVLLPAPGAGRVIEFVSGVGFLDFNSVAYTTNGILSVATTTTGTALSDAVAAAALVQAAADKYEVFQALSAETQLDVNEGLSLLCATGNPAAGNSPITLKIAYRIHDFN